MGRHKADTKKKQITVIMFPDVWESFQAIVKAKLPGGNSERTR
jgi:hypothetical protein